MDFVTLALGALATARLTRLVTTDRITLAPRMWLMNLLIARDKGEGLMMYLITCDWCVSVYMGAGAAVALRWGGIVALWVCAALAFSYVAGFLASKEGE